MPGDLPGRWLRGPIDGPGLPVFCLPFAGAGAAAYRGWLAAPVEGLRPLAVKLPGREDRLAEPMPARLMDLVEPLTDVISSAAAGRPFVLFGHSMGALLGFELARQLRRRGGDGPAHLVVSGSQAPQDLRLPRLHDLPAPALIAALEALGGLDPAVVAEPSLWRIAERVVRGDLAVCERYAYAHEQPLACAVTALGGTADPRVSPGELRGWRRQTTGPFALRLFEGGHFFVQSRQTEIMNLIAEQGRVTA